MIHEGCKQPLEHICYGNSRSHHSSVNPYEASARPRPTVISSARPSTRPPKSPPHHSGHIQEPRQGLFMTRPLTAGHKGQSHHCCWRRQIKNYSLQRNRKHFTSTMMLPSVPPFEPDGHAILTDGRACIICKCLGHPASSEEKTKKEGGHIALF